MPLYFDHCNYHSFNRLVNAWSFRRMSTGPDRGSYYHELFLRGRPNLHRMMRRLPKSHKKAPMSKQDEPDFYRMPKMEELNPSTAPGTSPAALAAAAAMPSTSMAMSAKAAAAQAMPGFNNFGAMNALAASGFGGGNFAAATNDMGQLSLMGLQGMFANHQNAIGMHGLDGTCIANNYSISNNGQQTMGNSADMDSNAAIQAAMARIAQQQLAERAQMSSQLLGIGANDVSQGHMQQQHEQHFQHQDQQQQDMTPTLEANLRATQLEHDRLQQQIASLQAQQQQIANEQLQLQQFQHQASAVQQMQAFQPNQVQQLNEASLQSKMAETLLGAGAAGGANSSADQVANSPAAKSG